VSTGSDDSDNAHAASQQPIEGSAPTAPVSIWDRIRDHKVVQWTLAYSAAAYTMLHAVEMVSEGLDWPHVVVRIVTLILFLGVPVATTLAWFHGHRAQHRVSGPELAILVVLLTIAGSVLWFVGRPNQERARAQVKDSSPASTVALPTVAAPPEKSIAVLPFADMSEKKDQEYFADGMAEEIINLLVKIPELKVIGRTSSFQFKGKTDDLRKIGGTLGAAYMVEGSVRRLGDHIRVTAQLIDTRDGAHRWSETYDRDVSDVLRVQEEIAVSLVRALQLEVANRLHRRAVPRSSEAYDSYLRGMHALNRFDQRGFEAAIADFRHTLKIDPEFVTAAEELSRALELQSESGFVQPQVGFEEARAAAEAVLKLDSKSALAHAVLGLVHNYYDWDRRAAAEEFKTAVALAPSDPVVLLDAAQERTTVKEWSEAMRLLEASFAVDPLGPSAHEVMGWVYVRLRRLSDAETAYHHLLEIAPSYTFAHRGLGLVLLAEGKPEAALAEMQRETPAGGQLAGLAVVYYALHRTRDADAALVRLEAETADDQPLEIAEVYAFRGQKDKAFEWLERAHAQKEWTLGLVVGDPLLQNLKGDPRYKAFLRKMNLPE